jgi:hypothetical protein
MCRHIIKCGFVFAGLLLFSLVSWAQDTPFSIDYFPNLFKYDGLKKVVNDGYWSDTTAGNLCDDIYVFHNEELAECCGCIVTPNGSRDFDVNKNFNSNNLTGSRFNELVIKQVSSGPVGAPSDASCNPAAPRIANGLHSWATKVQTVGSLVGITETPSTTASLGEAEYADLGEDCGVLIELGSGQGVCSCGTFD